MKSALNIGAKPKINIKNNQQMQMRLSQEHGQVSIGGESNDILTGNINIPV
jgi:hypothetical protein